MKIPLFIIALLLPLATQAEQLQFDKKVQGNKTHFNYRWKDHDEKQQDLAFTYDNKTLFSHFRNFKGYQAQRAKRSILVALEKAAAKINRKKVNINFIEHKDSIEYKLTSRDQKLMKQADKMLRQVRDETEADFLAKHFYNILTDQFKRTGIKPDHVRIAQQGTKDITPLSQAILDSNPQLRTRQMVSLVLSFVQSIPYSTLENRRLSSGAGFSPPLKLLNNNQGDCDSKVTLMASILKAMYPRMKVVIIYLPEHALIGVQIGHRNAEKYVKLAGRNFVLAEPTGPAMLELGEVGKRSKFFIDGKQFSYELF